MQAWLMSRIPQASPPQKIARKAFGKIVDAGLMDVLSPPMFSGIPRSPDAEQRITHNRRHVFLGCPFFAAFLSRVIAELWTSRANSDDGKQFQTKRQRAADA